MVIVGHGHINHELSHSDINSQLHYIDLNLTFHKYLVATMVHCHPLLYIIMWGLDGFGFPKGRDNSIENGSSTSLLSFSSLKCHLKQMKLEENRR